MRFLLFFLALTALSLGEPLLIYESTGGLGPRGGCHAETRIQPDGTIQWYDQGRDQRLDQNPNPKGFDGWFSTRMTPADLKRVQKAIAETKFSNIPTTPGAARPSYSDGGDETLTCGKHVLQLWTVKDASKLPLVQLLQELRSRYQVTPK